MTNIQKRNLLLFNSGRLISLIGSGIQMIAIPLYILDLTGSGASMGLFMMLAMIPTLTMAPLAGVLGDRLSRKSIAIYADYGRGILILFLSWMALIGRMNLNILFASQVFVSIMDSLFNAATAAMLPELVDESDLSRANAVRSGADSISMIIGPALGGIIYGFWGIKTIFLLNALSFIISAVCESFIIYRAKIRNLEKLSVKSFFNDIFEIVTYIFKHQGLKQLFIFAMITNFLAIPVIMVGMPFILKKVIGFSNQQYSYLMTSFMLGVLFGNILIGSVFAGTSSKKMMKSGFIINSVFFLLLGLTIFPKVVRYFGGTGWTYFAVIGIGFTLAGIFNAFVNTPIITNLQKMVRDEMRARFFSGLGLISQLAVPFGSLIFGFLLDKYPSHYLLSGIGLFFLLITIGFIIISSPEVYEPRPLTVDNPLPAEE